MFVVSDFWAGDFNVNLSILGRRHDLVAVRVRDPRETELPAVGLVRWLDAESGEEIVMDSSAPTARAAIRNRARAHDEALNHLFATRGVDVVDIDITKSYVDPLREFFMEREGRRQRRSGR